MLNENLRKGAVIKYPNDLVGVVDEEGREVFKIGNSLIVVLKGYEYTQGINLSFSFEGISNRIYSESVQDAVEQAKKILSKG